MVSARSIDKNSKASFFAFYPPGIKIFLNVLMIQVIWPSGALLLIGLFGSLLILGMVKGEIAMMPHSSKIRNKRGKRAVRGLLAGMAVCFSLTANATIMDGIMNSAGIPFIAVNNVEPSSDVTLNADGGRNFSAENNFLSNDFITSLNAQNDVLQGDSNVDTSMPTLQNVNLSDSEDVSVPERTVPEAPGLILLSIGLASLFGLRRRKHIAS